MVYLGSKGFCAQEDFDAEVVPGKRSDGDIVCVAVQAFHTFFDGNTHDFQAGERFRIHPTHRH